MHPFRSMTRQEAIEIDPRIEHVDAFVVVKDTFDLWARYSGESDSRPGNIRAMKWDQINPGFGFRLGEGLYLTFWFYVLDDSVTICAIESEDPRVMAWVREFAEMWGVPAFEMGPTLDFAFRSSPLGDDHPYWNEVRAKGNKELSCELSNIGLILGGRVDGFRETNELLRQKLRREAEERMEAERIRWENRPAPRVMPEQCKIPNIGLDELSLRHQHLQPMVIDDSGELCNVKKSFELKILNSTSFIWDPTIEGSVTGVKPVATSISLHSFSYHGFFKPSIAEVLAQAPENWQEFVGYSVEGPEEVFDINCEPHARDAGFHVATVTWYARA